MMKLVAKTLYGLEKVLAGELTNLGAVDVKTVNRAVLFKGEKELLYKANYCTRTALSVLMPIGNFSIRSKDDLYRASSKIEWDRYFGLDDTFSVTSVVSSPFFDHSGYAGLVLKDAIADNFRKRSGKRPSVNSDDPGILINLHISNDLVTVSLDSSVVPLFKRGYRAEQAVAPLNEVLAAGILLISGWHGRTTLIDPMCGSGTIPIEAGLIATGTPPGKFRKFFGFQRWKDFDDALFTKIKYECQERSMSSPVKIYGYDIKEEAVRLSQANVSNAGLEGIITLETGDFRNIRSNDNEGYVFINPPYGIRIQPAELDELYSMIGSTLKHSFAGNTAWLITSNKESLKHIGLKPKEKHTLFNGALECTLLKYEMYQGTRKAKL